MAIVLTVGYLSRASLDPKGKLLLYFGKDVAVLEGRNLHHLRQKVRMHRASEIRQGVEAEDALKPECATHLKRTYLATVRELEEIRMTQDDIKATGR